MNTTKTAVVTILLLLCSATLALAGDLVGEWTEMDNWGARAGTSEHKLGDGDHFLSMENAGFTLKVTEMSPDKRAFHGEWCSVNDCEDLVGAVRSDGSLLLVDEDGYFTGTLLGGNLEICYMEGNASSRIVNCRIMQRK